MNARDATYMSDQEDVLPHIICVDDEEGIVHALSQQLAPFKKQYEVDLVQSGQDALELIEELDEDGEPLAMMIVDQLMPGMKGTQVLEAVHKTHKKTAKILLTGQAGLDAVVHAINYAGLDRYISKPWDEPDLRITVETLLKKYELERENERLLEDLKIKNKELSALNAKLEARVEERTHKLEAANEKLAKLAITDGLTGVYNHRYFHERLTLEIERSLRSSLPLSLIMIDVDHFKEHNDRFGHLAGDQALKKVAELIKKGRRKNDAISRYGGEEFTVILPDTSIDDAKIVAEQMRARVQRETKVDQQYISISLGVAVCPKHAKKTDELIRCADEALYRAKDKGRNRVEIAKIG